MTMWARLRRWARLERRDELRQAAEEAEEAVKDARRQWPEVRKAQRTFTAEVENAMRKAQGHGA